ncbi:MAG: hypothetical protein AAGK04_10315 [Planctomycetota bacterium]
MKPKPIIITATTLLALVAIVVFIATRPKPRPNYEIAELDAVLDFTLLTDRFNDLPIEERVEMLGQLISRFQSMDAGDSVLMAAFAAGIQGAAREQLEKNAARLAIDLMDRRAKDYRDVPPEERAQYLDEATVEFIRTTSLLTGEVDERSDNDILKDAREQAERDKQRFQTRGVSGDEAGGMFTFLNGRIGSKTNPHERARVNLYMRDLVRHLRSEPIATGDRR